MSPFSRRGVLGVILVGYLMIVIDISIVITALPKMHTSLHMSTTALSWVQNAFRVGADFRRRSKWKLASM